MGSSPIARTHLSPFLFTNPLNSIDASPSHIHLNPQKPISRNPPISKKFSYNCKVQQQPSSVSEKVQKLGFEFRSLPQPIDRVKRLLHYAATLPPFEESSRIQENRVLGCTTQVWLEAAMDGNGAMRFRVDSDSEITKGFCSCLIWVLDGAALPLPLHRRLPEIQQPHFLSLLSSSPARPTLPSPPLGLPFSRRRRKGIWADLQTSFLHLEANDSVRIDPKHL